MGGCREGTVYCYFVLLVSLILVLLLVLNLVHLTQLAAAPDCHVAIENVTSGMVPRVAVAVG